MRRIRREKGVSFSNKGYQVDSDFEATDIEVPGFDRVAKRALKDAVKHSPEVRGLLSDSVQSSKTITIAPAFAPSRTSTDNELAMPQADGSPGPGDDATIFLDFAATDLRTMGVDGELIEQPTYGATLVHELAHATHSMLGIEPNEGGISEDFTVHSGLPAEEEMALYHENIYRGEMGLPTRAVTADAYNIGASPSAQARRAQGYEAWRAENRRLPR